MLLTCGRRDPILCPLLAGVTSRVRQLGRRCTLRTALLVDSQGSGRLVCCAAHNGIGVEAEEELVLLLVVVSHGSARARSGVEYGFLSYVRLRRAGMQVADLHM